MGGLSLTFSPAGSNWDITLNGLNGSGDSDFTDLSESFGAGWGQSGQYDIDRKDYEILYRYRLEESPIYLGLGFRYVDAEEIYTGDRDGVVEVETTEVSLGELAVGFSTQASEGSRHSVFGNLLLGVGSFDYLSAGPSYEDVVEDGTSIMMDANIGYQYVINQSTSFSARYRAIALQSNGDETDTSVIHGPDLAFTFRF
jgi:hypothetical protein